LVARDEVQRRRPDFVFGFAAARDREASRDRKVVAPHPVESRVVEWGEAESTKP
jgi:hypothetical protein